MTFFLLGTGSPSAATPERMLGGMTNPQLTHSPQKPLAALDWTHFVMNLDE